MRELDAQKRRRIRRHSPRHRGRKPGEKRLQPAVPIQPLDRAADGRFPLRALQPALDRVDGEHGDPHGHAGAGARDRDGPETEFRGSSVWVRAVVFWRGHFALHVLVGGEIGGAAGPVASERHGRAAEDAADSALPV